MRFAQYALLFPCIWRIFIGVLMGFYMPVAYAQKFYFDKITSQNGLSHNTVYAIAQDYKGFMWFGTRDGLNRYDSQHIKTYYFENRAPMIETSRINCLHPIGKELYVGTGNGLFTYNFVQDSFQQIPLSFTSPHSVNDIYSTPDGKLWVSTRNGVYRLKNNQMQDHLLKDETVLMVRPYKQGIYWVLLEKRLILMNDTGEIIFEAIPEKSFGSFLPDLKVATIYTDKEGIFWVATKQGVFRFNDQTFTFSILPLPMFVTGKEPLLVRTIIEDNARRLWIGTETGVIVYDKKNQAVQQYGQSFYDSPHHLSDKSVYAAFAGKDGVVWLGTYFGGINYAKPLGYTFDFIFPDVASHSLSGKAVSQLMQQANGQLWVATEDGGISIHHPDKTFSYLTTDNGLTSNNIHSLYTDVDGSIWIGTFMTGLNIYQPKTGRILKYIHESSNPKSLSNNSVYALLRDRRGVMWIGTQRGLNIYNDKTQAFHVFEYEGLKKAFIYDIAEDVDGNLWFATRYNGIVRYEPKSGKIDHFLDANTPAIQSNQIISIYQDSQHNLWLGSLDGGVVYYNYHKKQFVRIKILENIPSNTIYGILEDNDHDIWLSTNKGLICYSPTQKTWIVFDKSNGLPTTQFNFKSFLKTADGHMYFGSINGLCFFSPTIAKERVYEPVCYFTSLKLFNKEVPISADAHALLNKHIDEIPSITLAYGQNNVTLDFVGINYFSKGNNYYTYYLEGFEETWNPKTDKNSITFTNLSPGQYTFHLKSYKSNGQLSAAERTLAFVVQPPFWRTYYAWAVYVLLIAAAIYLYARFVAFVNEQKLAVRVERLEKEKDHELSKQKVNLFTLLSHEFNTPLTLITAVIDKISSDTSPKKPELLDNIKVIKKNALRLQLLVEQLFEFRKAQAKHQNVQIRTTDLISLVKENVAVFKPLLDVKKVQLQTEFSHPYFHANLDADKLDMILANLLFTSISGAVEGQTFQLMCHIENDKAVKTQAMLQLQLTGEIAPTVIDLLQKNVTFFDTSQELVPENNTYTLSIVLINSLLRVLNSHVTVTHTEAVSSIMITIPFLKGSAEALLPGVVKNQEKDSALKKYILNLEEEQDEATDESRQDDQKSSILIAENNKELLLFLKKHFAENYHVLVATSFQEAMKKAESQLPDVIVCDNTLVNGKGQDLCSYLKEAEPTRFIPIILLSEIENEQSVIKGLYSGADAFLKKPFKLKELDLLINNMLKSRVLLKEKLFGSLSGPLLNKLPGGNKDQKLLLTFAELVAQHYKDHSLTAEQLADRMNCSRSLLHTKLKKLSGLSTKEYLNEYRLNIAHQLLQQGAQVAEAAYQVGFNDPNYFSRVFKQKYGVTPSQIADHMPDKSE